MEGRCRSRAAIYISSAMLRTLWFLTNLVIFTSYYASVAVIAGLIGIRAWKSGVYDWCIREWSFKLLKAARVPYKSSGMDKIPKGQPVVFVSNHQSWFDIFLLATQLPQPSKFVVKKELLKIPLLGRAIKSAGHIIIDRQDRTKAMDAYENAAAAIREGVNAVIFAEGTRSRTGELLPFKKGPFVLAVAAQVPIVPIYCAGTFSLLQKGSVRIRPQPIALLVGDPIPTAGLAYEDRQDLLQKTRAAIEALRVDSALDLG